MLEQLRPADVVVVWRLDRLGRSLKNLISLVEDLAGVFGHYGVGIVVAAGTVIELSCLRHRGLRTALLFRQPPLGRSPFRRRGECRSRTESGALSASAWSLQ
jgi:hypothetical protein